MVDTGDINPSSNAPLRSLKVLIVDDIFINHVILESILLAEGHEVESAKSGVAAVAAVKKNDFDLILMDINMPVMDGKIATRNIRNLPAPKSEIPIIACSADIGKDHIKEYREAGLNSAIGKPIVKKDLTDVLENFQNGTLDFPGEITKNLPPQNGDDQRTSEILTNLHKEIGG